MLFIVFGTFGEIGKQTRRYFKSQGIPEIKKENYIPPNADLKQFSVVPESKDKDFVTSCTYHYELSVAGTDEKRIVGFNDKQIRKAVHGECDRLITLSSESFGFIKAIKMLYSDHVRVVFAYIEECTVQSELEKHYSNLNDATIKAKLYVNRKIKKILVENRQFFDDIVLYSNDGILNYDSLLRQYDVIIKRAKESEKALNDKDYSVIPYRGNSPFLFVSYAHKDFKSFVEPIIDVLRYKRCRAWYDKEGIFAGQNWELMLKDRIKDCAAILLLSSEKSTQNRDSYVPFEIYCAMFYHIPIIRIRIDESEYGIPIERKLQQYHHINYSCDNLENELCKALKEICPEIFESSKVRKSIKNSNKNKQSDCKAEISL